jgi:hypothetical protein
LDDRDGARDKADISEVAHLPAPPGGAYAKHLLLGVADLDGDGLADAYGAVADTEAKGARAAAWISVAGKSAVPALSPRTLDEAVHVGEAQRDGSGGDDAVLLGKSSGVLLSVYRVGCSDGDACSFDVCDAKTGCTTSPRASDLRRWGLQGRRRRLLRRRQPVHDRQLRSEERLQIREQHQHLLEQRLPGRLQGRRLLDRARQRDLRQRGR